jgi:hypothetical protein
MNLYSLAKAGQCLNLHDSMLASIRLIRIGFISKAVCLCMASCLFGQNLVPNATVEGTSHRDVREQAARNIPFASLTPEAVRKIRPVVEDPTIFRRMPTQSMPCDPEFFNFLVRYPEVLVEIWQEMGVTKVETKRTGPFSFDGSDGAGTTCSTELVLGSERMHLYFSDGYYEGGLVARKLEGRCVILVYSQSSVSDSGQPFITTHMDVFLKLDNVGADLIAKTISPLVVKTADYNYIETLRFVSQLSMASQRDPEAVDRLAKRLDGLDPDVRNRFVQVANQSALRRDRMIANQWSKQVEPQSNEAKHVAPTTSRPGNPRQVK